MLRVRLKKCSDIQRRLTTSILRSSRSMQCVVCLRFFSSVLVYFCSNDTHMLSTKHTKLDWNTRLLFFSADPVHTHSLDFPCFSKIKTFTVRFVGFLLSRCVFSLYYKESGNDIKRENNRQELMNGMHGRDERRRDNIYLNSLCLVGMIENQKRSNHYYSIGRHILMHNRCRRDLAHEQTHF